MTVRVAIVDDDELIRIGLRAIVDTQPDLDVVAEAGDGADVPDIVARTRPHVLLTDVRMPGISGIELVEEMKRRGASAPVIVITGHADVPLAIQAMRAGVADFIEKPFDDEVMLGAIGKALAEQAGDDAAETERRAVREHIALLSPREREVMDGLVAGEANKAIAFDLGISARTVEVYRANVMMKMQARTLSDLVRMVTIAQLS